MFVFEGNINLLTFYGNNLTVLVTFSNQQDEIKQLLFTFFEGPQWKYNHYKHVFASFCQQQYCFLSLSIFTGPLMFSFKYFNEAFFAIFLHFILVFPLYFFSLANKYLLFQQTSNKIENLSIPDDTKSVFLLQITWMIYQQQRDDRRHFLGLWFS